jgi:hypothetical protein
MIHRWAGPSQTETETRPRPCGDATPRGALPQHRCWRLLGWPCDQPPKSQALWTRPHRHTHARTTHGPAHTHSPNEAHTNTGRRTPGGVEGTCPQEPARRSITHTRSNSQLPAAAAVATTRVVVGGCVLSMKSVDPCSQTAVSGRAWREAGACTASCMQLLVECARHAPPRTAAQLSRAAGTHALLQRAACCLEQPLCSAPASVCCG